MHIQLIRQPNRMPQPQPHIVVLWWFPEDENRHCLYCGNIACTLGEGDTEKAFGVRVEGGVLGSTGEAGRYG